MGIMATQVERIIVEYDAKIDGYDTKMQGIQKTNTKVNGSISGVGRSAGMAGIQVQQFVGQIQGGQSAMLALSQQSADLGFVLGAPLLGAVVGISASIAGIMLPNLFKANEALKELEENTDSLTKTFSKLSDSAKTAAISGLQEKLKEQAKTFGELTNQVKEAEREFSNSKFLQGQSGGGIISFIAGVDTPEEARKELTSAQVALSKLGIELEVTAKKIRDFSSGEDNENQINELIDGLKEQAQLYGATARQQELYIAAKQGANIEQLNEINQIHDLIDAKKEEIALRKEGAELFDLLNTVDPASQADPAALAEIIERDQINALKLEQEQAFIETLNELKFTGLESEEELLAKEVELHQSMLDNKLINLEQFNSAQEQSAKKYEKSKNEEGKIDKKTSVEKLQTQQNAIRAGMALNEALFGDNKAIAAGLIVADTATGIQKSLAINPYDYVNVGIIAATGAANLANALGASKGGGSISSGASSSSSIAPPQRDFEPETSSLDFRDSTSGGSTQARITFAEDSGDDLIDAIAKALNKGQSEGKF